LLASCATPTSPRKNRSRKQQKRRSISLREHSNDVCYRTRRRHAWRSRLWARCACGWMNQHGASRRLLGPMQQPARLAP
jgi:hypothetical protein